MGFLDSIKNFFTGGGGSSSSQTSTPVSTPTSFDFSLPNQSVVPSFDFGGGTKTSTSAVSSKVSENSLQSPNMSTPDGAVFVPPPTEFKLRSTEPVSAQSLDQETVDLGNVQSTVRSGTQPVANAGFDSAKNKPDPEDEATADDTSPETVRGQIQQGLLDILQKDNTEEKARLREEAQIEEKSRETNRILNQLRKIRVDFEAEKDELENNNPRGRSMGAINNDINKLTKDTNRNLAYKSIEYDIARNDLVSAEATLNARIQDMKDEEAKQIQLYKTLYDFVQDDMSESEKLEAQQAFQAKEAERSHERAKELAQYNSLLRREEDRLSASLKQAVTAQEAQEASKALVPSLQQKAGDLTTAINNLTNGDTGNVVGANKLARFSLTRAFSSDDENFIGTVDQLTSRETLDTLVALKARGGTLGALSEKELQMLEASASRIGTWRVRDDEGNTTHYDVSESEMKKELMTLRTLTNKAIVEAGGSLDPDPLGLGVNADPLSLGI